MPVLIAHAIANALLVVIISRLNNIDSDAIAGQVFLSHLIDLDHLLADPIYDPDRCGINVHPLHSWYVIMGYVVGIWTRYRYFFIATLLHVGMDLLDCL